MVPLAQLGFDVCAVTASDLAPARAALAEVLGDGGRQRVACESAGIEDASADWVVLAFGAAPELGLLAEAARILRPGGWVWVETERGSTRDGRHRRARRRAGGGGGAGRRRRTDARDLPPAERRRLDPRNVAQQSDFGPVVLGSRDTPTFADICAPTDGFVVKGNVELNL